MLKSPLYLMNKCCVFSKIYSFLIWNNGSKMEIVANCYLEVIRERDLCSSSVLSLLKPRHPSATGECLISLRLTQSNPFEEVMAINSVNLTRTIPTDDNLFQENFMRNKKYSKNFV
jgi:hypothetical protein